MSDPIFVQKSRVGRTVFQIRGDQLEIYARNFGRRASGRIPLAQISSDYELVARRFPVLIYAPLGTAALSYALIYAAFHQTTVPREIATGPIVFFAISVLAVFRGVPRLEIFVFQDFWRRPLFYIVRESGQADACNAFVAALLDRIQAAETGEPVDPTTPSEFASSLPKQGLAAVFGSGQNRWWLALVAGIVSAGVPPALQDLPAFDPYMLPLVIFASIGGLLCGTLSFVARERHRYWSLLGMAFSLVAPLFY